MCTTPHYRLFIKLIPCLFAFGFWSFAPMGSIPEFTNAAEICDNGIDDNNDGLIDLNDPECDCEVIEPVSLIPNPSFEDMDCCPDNRSQLDCASVWIQASEPTTDYIHTCDWLGWPNFPPPFPFPDGEGIMGFRDGRVRQNNEADVNWKEYAGACLLSPLVADSSYRFDFDVGFVSSLRSPPINITFFGTTDCDNLPFGIGNEGFGCPTNGPSWVRLGSTSVSGESGNKWVNTSIEVTPTEDITAIAIGPDCPPVFSPVSIYYFFDNLLLADFKSFELKIAEVSHPCQSNFSLKIPNNPDFTYQWYINGVALVGETFNYLTKTFGEGDYQVRIDDGTSCRVSVSYEHKLPFLSTTANRTICINEYFLFGDMLLNTPGFYTDTFKSINNCDSIVSLNLSVLGEIADTVNVKIFEGESYILNNKEFKTEGDHLLTLVSHQACDSLVLLHLEYFHIYFPNVFSPNNDGINDVFKVYAEEGTIEQGNLTIFDRWGSEVFSGIEWDGQSEDTFVGPGVFVYLAKLKMNDGIERQFSGSVTVAK